MGWGMARGGHPYLFSLATGERPNRSFNPGQARASPLARSPHLPIVFLTCYSSLVHCSAAVSSAPAGGAPPARPTSSSPLAPASSSPSAPASPLAPHLVLLYAWIPTSARSHGVSRILPSVCAPLAVRRRDL